MSTTLSHPSGVAHGTEGHSCNGDWNRDHWNENLARTYIFEPAPRPDTDGEEDDGEGVLVAARGMNVTVMAVFHDWNCVPDLTIVGVYVHETGFTTHITPAEMPGWITKEGS